MIVRLNKLLKQYRSRNVTVELIKDIEALERTIVILSRESMEQGDIPLAQWAAIHGLDESYARQKARRGSLKTAHKIGRDWFIAADEPNIDNRRRRG